MRETVSRTVRRDGVTSYTFRGSEFGMCEHRHIAYLRGLREGQPSDLTRKMFRAGNDGEGLAKDWLHELAAKDSRIRIAEFATGWQNQSSVKISELVGNREVNLVCSPDGRIEADCDLREIIPQSMIVDYSPGPIEVRDYSLEVKCFGDSSLRKLRKGVESGSTLAYQTSGVAAGQAAREGRPHGVIVMALKRVEVRDEEGKVIDYAIDANEPPVFVIQGQPVYSADQCLERCWGIVNAYEAGKWVDCTSKYFCRFPHQPAPICDGLGSSMLATLHETYEAYKVARRDAEGILAGLQPGQTVSGYRYHRELQSLPVVTPL